MVSFMGKINVILVKVVERDGNKVMVEFESFCFDGFYYDGDKDDVVFVIRLERIKFYLVENVVFIEGIVDFVEYYGFFMEVVGFFGDIRIIVRMISDREV